MAKPRLFLQRVFGKPAPSGDPVAEALNHFRAPKADTLELARRLVATLRPQSRGDTGAAERYQAMLDQLEADPVLLAAFARAQ